MKNFYKILVVFLALFMLGLFITYKSINHTFKKAEKEHATTSFPDQTLYDNTFRIG